MLVDVVQQADKDGFPLSVYSDGIDMNPSPMYPGIPIKVTDTPKKIFARDSPNIALKMLRVFLRIGCFGSATLFGLTLILRMIMTHEVNTKLPGGEIISLLSIGELDAARLRHQLFPHCHLGAATKGSMGAPSLLKGATSVLGHLTM